MEVGNEMEIFIALTKYNNCQKRKEGNDASSYNLAIKNNHHQTSVQSIYDGTVPRLGIKYELTPFKKS